jgi:hypothetical protein
LPETTRRRPNLWILIPSVVAGVLSGALGWAVTDVSCRVEVDGVIQHCRGWSALVAVIAGVGALIGMMVVLVLVFRSIAEYREAMERGQEPLSRGERPPKPQVDRLKINATLWPPKPNEFDIT